MQLGWNEIKQRAMQFSREWVQESCEDAEAKSFWDAFFHVFGVPRRRTGAGGDSESASRDTLALWRTSARRASRRAGRPSPLGHPVGQRPAAV